jgi:hypothetical protein
MRVTDVTTATYSIYIVAVVTRGSRDSYGFRSTIKVHFGNRILVQTRY